MTISTRLTGFARRDLSAVAQRAKAEPITQSMTKSEGDVAETSVKRKAPPGGGTGRDFHVQSLWRRGARTWSQAVTCRPLLDHLHDAARAQLHQHGEALPDPGPIGRGAECLRHVVIGDAVLRHHSAHDHAIRDG